MISLGVSNYQCVNHAGIMDDILLNTKRSYMRNTPFERHYQGVHIREENERDGPFLTFRQLRFSGGHG